MPAQERASKEERARDMMVMIKVGSTIILEAPFSILLVMETRISAVSVCFEKQQQSIMRKTNRITSITIPPATLLNSKQTKENTSKLMVIPIIVMFMAPDEQSLQHRSSRTLSSRESPAIPITTLTNILNRSFLNNPWSLYLPESLFHRGQPSEMAQMESPRNVPRTMKRSRMYQLSLEDLKVTGPFWSSGTLALNSGSILLTYG